MIRRATQLIPERLMPYAVAAYRRVDPWLGKVDHAVDRRTMSPSGFAQLLGELGVGAGVTVMVHSSMDEIARRVPEMNAIELIRLLQRLLGPEGTLLMPTFPFVGSQQRYVETHETFDLRKTPSRVGLVTEVFRRMPGVRRSLHPTHPVAGWGRLVDDLLATHHLGTTFGPTSPICRLREYEGLVVGLGTPVRRSFTIEHVAEELHPRTRAHAFETEPRLMTIIDGTRRIPYRLYVQRPRIDGAFDGIERRLLKDGTLKRITRHGLACAVSRADRFITRTLELIDQGMYRF